MHHSRLAGFIIDCQTDDIEAASQFWSAALGMAPRERQADRYVSLDASAQDLAVEVQRVEHPSRVHLDIESDDIVAEVERLEQLGARRLAQVETWWVMEAPTGQRFCVIPPKQNLVGKAGVTAWPGNVDHGRLGEVELEQHFENELRRVTGRSSNVWGQHEGLAWVRWSGSNEVVLYDLRRAVAVLASFGDDAGATQEGMMHVVTAFEDASVYRGNLEQFPWWKALAASYP